MANRLAVVFGGSGFIGRHLVQRLAAEGWRVRVAVRDPEGASFLKPLGDVGQVVPVYADVVAAYRSGDIRRFDAAKAGFLDLVGDVDALVGTRPEFLLGRWLAAARKWGTTPQESDLYERNARLLLTVWGPPSPGAFLSDYAGRQWSGLIRGFYLRRWEKFFAFLAAQPASYSDDQLAKVMGRPGNDSSPFYRELSDWEYRWCDEHGVFPSEPTGDSVLEAHRLLGKWRPVMREIYPRFEWKKLNGPPHG